MDRPPADDPGKAVPPDAGTETGAARPSHRPPAAPGPTQEREERRIALRLLCVCAVLIGVVLVGLVHNLFFLRTFAVAHDASAFTPPGPWGALVILVPVVGGVGVTWLVSTFAPEAKGHGVPEVMDAIYYKWGMIRPAVALVKSLASALAIGSGAAVGREGPIIQIGSALDSMLGQIVPMLTGQRIVLVASGGRDRGDLQHADRRRAVRDRTDAARDQRRHLPSSRTGDRHRDLYRAAVLRRRPRLRGPGRSRSWSGAARRPPW